MINLCRLTTWFNLTEETRQDRKNRYKPGGWAYNPDRNYKKQKLLSREVRKDDKIFQERRKQERRNLMDPVARMKEAEERRKRILRNSPLVKLEKELRFYASEAPVLENLNTIKKRMKGWQLVTFNESYKHKIVTGVSIYKKKVLLKNN